MTTTMTPPSTGRAAGAHPAVRTMWIGLALTVLATVAPLLDLVTTGTIEAHVRGAYPQWPDSKVHQDMTALTVGLATLGVLGLVGWIVALWATRRGRGWARGLSTTLWLVGTTVVLFVLSAPADPYDRLAPVGLGLITALPCVAGLVAVVQLWRHRPGAGRTAAA